jgi:hypothetical protein
MSFRPFKTFCDIGTSLPQVLSRPQDFHLPLAVSALLSLQFFSCLPVIHIQQQLQVKNLYPLSHHRILLVLPSSPYQSRMFTKVLVHYLLCQVTLQAHLSHSLAFQLSHHPLCQPNLQIRLVLHQLQQLFLVSSRSLAEAVVAEAQQGPPLLLHTIQSEQELKIVFWKLIQRRFVFK